MSKLRDAFQSRCHTVRQRIKKTVKQLKSEKNNENRKNESNGKGNQAETPKKSETATSHRKRGEPINCGAYRSRLMKKKQHLVGLVILVSCILVIVLLHQLSRSGRDSVPSSGAGNAAFDTRADSTRMDGVLSTDFTEKNTLSALEQQQQEMDRLTRLVVALRESAEKAEKKAASLAPSQSDKTALIQQIKAILAAREAEAKKNKNAGENSPRDPSEILTSSGKSPDFQQKPSMTESAAHRGTHSFKPGVRYSTNSPPVVLSVLAFSYTDDASNARKKKEEALKKIKKTGKTVANYVPAGTFVTGVLLEGADANASVNGQSDTVGILVRLLDEGTLPNGHHSHLRGCFVLASLYGDISSERGEARLTTLSCTRADGSVLERPVRGYLSFAGKEGIKGHPVMRNGKILAMAGFSGMLSGFGASLQQASQTQSTSALGTTATVDSGALFQNGLANGASTAMGQLAHYYIQRADQYHPVIEIGSGTMATVIFQEGFSLVDQEAEAMKLAVAENIGGLTEAFEASDFQTRHGTPDVSLFSAANPAVSDSRAFIHDEAVDDLVREAQSLSPHERTVALSTAMPFTDSLNAGE